MIQIQLNNLRVKEECAPCNSGPAVFTRRPLCRTDYYGGENAQKSDAVRDATTSATDRS